MLLAYCAGLIAVCTGLLIIATVFTIQNYWMLRALSEGAPGKHETVPVPPERPRTVRYYESVETVPDAGEWTGPVTPYTPQQR